MTAVPGYGEMFGGLAPAEIWHDFMTVAMDGRSCKEFPEPKDPFVAVPFFGTYATDGPPGLAVDPLAIDTTPKDSTKDKKKKDKNKKYPSNQYEAPPQKAPNVDTTPAAPTPAPTPTPAPGGTPGGAGAPPG